MRETRSRTSIVRSVVSGSGPPSLRGFSRPKIKSSFAGLPCTGKSCVHNCVTLSSLEKKRCPPMSMRLPLYVAVREIRKPRRSRADNQYSLFLHRSPVQLLYLRLLSREKRLFRCILNKNFYKKIITRRQEKVKEIPLFYLPAFFLRFS